MTSHSASSGTGGAVIVAGFVESAIKKTFYPISRQQYLETIT
jgi:hypothetical protein